MQIIEAFSEAIEKLERFYVDTKDNIEKMMDEWENTLYRIKGFKRIN